jgi:hypothetical protein
MSLRDKLLPVPSYPWIVDDNITMNGPINCLTNVIGIAAASSITRSSACESFW